MALSVGILPVFIISTIYYFCMKYYRFVFIMLTFVQVYITTSCIRLFNNVSITQVAAENLANTFCAQYGLRCFLSRSLIYTVCESKTLYLCVYIRPYCKRRTRQKPRRRARSVEFNKHHALVTKLCTLNRADKDNVLLKLLNRDGRWVETQSNYSDFYQKRLVLNQFRQKSWAKRNFLNDIFIHLTDYI